MNSRVFYYVMKMMAPLVREYYWHEIRKEPRPFSSRQQVEDLLMVCEAFSYNGKTHIAFLNGQQSSDDYQKRLEVQLHPFGKLLGGDK